MRFLKILASVCFTVTVAAAGHIQAQSTLINGPVVGFTPDAAGATIEPILGIPGASLLANPLELGMEIRGAVVSPRQEYALALGAADGQPIFIDLTGRTPITPMPGNYIRPEIIAVSPSGSAAAIYDSGSGSIEIIGSLPRNPEVAYQLDASAIPGRASSVALSDDGSVTLVTFVESDRTTLWMLDSSGAMQRLPVDQPAGAAFFVNRTDAIIADDSNHTAFIATNAGRTTALVPLISNVDGIDSISKIAVSEDGTRILLGDTHSGNVAIVDMETRASVLVSCGCELTGLHRLRGNSVFRLTNASDQPIMMLEAAGSEPRVVIVPPNTSTLSEAQ